MANTQNLKSASPELQKQLEEEVKAKEQSALTPEPTPPQATIAPVATPSMSPDKQMFADALATKKILDTYPKVMINLPCYIGEKPGVSEDYASINGYRYTVKKGVMVEVPEPIAKLFMDHYNIQMGETEYGKTMRLDRSAQNEAALT